MKRLKILNKGFGILIFTSVLFFNIHAQTAPAQNTQGAEDNTFSINVKNTDIADIAVMLKKRLNKNIIIHSGVDKKISINLEGVSPRRALELICRTHELNWVEEEDTVIIFSREAFMLNNTISDSAIERIDINYRSAKSIFEKITLSEKGEGEQKTSGAGINILGGKAHYDESSSIIILIDSPENIKKLKEIITQFDIPPKSVLIEAKIVTIELKDEQKLGINWSKLGMEQVKANFTANAGGVQITGDTSIKLGKFTLPFELVLDSIAQNNDVKLLSSPRISVIHGEEANIVVGKNISYKSAIVNENGTTVSDIKFVETGIKLKVKPFIFGKGIRLEIHPEVSSPIQNQASEAPDVNTSEATSIIYVEDGETIILGGLIEEEKSSIKAGVAFLQRVPIIGLPFRTTIRRNNKSEMVVFIKVKIL